MNTPQIEESDWSAACIAIVREAVQNKAAENPSVHMESAVRGYMAIFEALLMAYKLSIEIDKSPELGRCVLAWARESVKHYDDGDTQGNP
jgi:hypothetical protein